MTICLVPEYSRMPFFSSLGLANFSAIIETQLALVIHGRMGMNHPDREWLTTVTMYDFLGFCGWTQAGLLLLMALVEGVRKEGSDGPTHRAGSWCWPPGGAGLRQGLERRFSSMSACPPG